ncbi:MAG: glycosyltransferase [Erysipelotrichaceae bacterium]|nr:glycosyltransferase [Erysipelotrichaceae bacterium]
MYKVLYINSVCGFGSTGRIVADLTKTDDYESLVCFGRKKDFADVNSFQFANFFDNALGAIRTILFDNNLNICTSATKRLIKKIKEYNPDIIHLHNIHGYYINVEMLINFLKGYGKPVVWTFHDCWPFTGYCSDAYYVNCEKYQKECVNCDHWFAYPFSLFKQNVTKDFNKKKELFKDFDNLTIVTPSKWLAGICNLSFLRKKRIVTVNNGIDLNDFKPSKAKNDKLTVLAVASFWTKDKGSEDLIELVKLLDKDIDVVVVGNGSDKIEGVKAISHTNNKAELVDLYSSAHVLINPTLDDNFPSVNIESIACGTPVITYRTGGSPEIIDGKTGVVVDKGNYKAMAEVVNSLYRDYYFKPEDCVERSKRYSKEVMKKEYRKLYESLLSK